MRALARAFCVPSLCLSALVAVLAAAVVAVLAAVVVVAVAGSLAGPAWAQDGAGDGDGDGAVAEGAPAADLADSAAPPSPSEQTWTGAKAAEKAGRYEEALLGYRSITMTEPDGRRGPASQRRSDWLAAREDRTGGFDGLRTLEEARARTPENEADPVARRAPVAAAYASGASSPALRLDAAIWLVMFDLGPGANVERAVQISSEHWASLAGEPDRARLKAAHVRALIAAGRLDEAEAVEQELEAARDAAEADARASGGSAAGAASGQGAGGPTGSGSRARNAKPGTAEQTDRARKEQRRSLIAAACWMMLGGFLVGAGPSSFRGWSERARPRPTGLLLLVPLVGVPWFVSSSWGLDLGDTVWLLLAAWAALHLVSVGALKATSGRRKRLTRIGAAGATIASAFLVLRAANALDWIGL